MSHKIATIVGARPQFIKAAPVSDAIRKQGHTELMIHTGQHYDFNMSETFFEELNIPKPTINLQIGSGSHGQQTGRMLIAIEEVLITHKPNLVIVYGDTNSTIAGALASVKLHIDVAHVEAGLRSFNRTMPEEHNRVLTDHCSNYLLCPTEKAVKQLEREGIKKNVHLVGDTMYDAVAKFSSIAEVQSSIMTKLGISPKSFFLATIHRPYNTDDPENLSAILRAFSELNLPIIFPVHPRTREKIAGLKGNIVSANIHMIEPIGYKDMLVLQKNAYRILTDSGGIQKEAFFLETPCITLRTETEWVETTEAGWNILVGADYDKIVETVANWAPPSHKPPALFGDGNAADKIVNLITH